MLRIKDNVDLKELEKFGFEKDRSGWLYSKQIKLNDVAVSTVSVNVDNRKLALHQIYSNIQEDIIYDLIVAGLVEKC